MAVTAPRRDRTRREAHSPKAREPPDRANSTTMAPSSTSKKKIFRSMPSIRVRNSGSKLRQGAKPSVSSAPTTHPASREEYTSLVAKASTMATAGGSSAQPVAAKEAGPPRSAKETAHSSTSTAASTAPRLRKVRFMVNILAFPISRRPGGADRLL